MDKKHLARRLAALEDARPAPEIIYATMPRCASRRGQWAIFLEHISPELYNEIMAAFFAPKREGAA